MSRRFPNGVTVYDEVLSGGRKKYTAERNGWELGAYYVERSGFDNPKRSHGNFNCKYFSGFYFWLRAARGA